MKPILSALLAFFISLNAAGASLPVSPFAGEWLVLGPLENTIGGEACAGFFRDLFAGADGKNGEASIRPAAGQKNLGKTWRRADSADGSLDLLAAAGPAENAVAYAYRRFDSASDAKAALKIGSDDGIAIWLNGEKILMNHTHRALSENSDSVPVLLRKGFNDILIKVDQGTGGWGFALGLRSLEEEAAAQRDPPKELRLILGQATVDPGQAVQGIVLSEPSWCIEAKLEATLLGGKGEVLAKTPFLAGRPFSLSVPAGYSGTARLSVTALAPYAGLPPVSREVYVGDRALWLKNCLAFARLKRDKSVTEATLSYLADRIEKKGNAEFISAEETERALFAIHRLMRISSAGAGSPGTFPLLTGLTQLAYRSKLDGRAQPFSLYVPEGYRADKKYSLVVALHGYGGNDWDEANKLAKLNPSDFIIVGAYGRGNLGYQLTGEQDVLDVMDLVTANLSVDPDRVYLTGSSMGGLGTWRIGQFYADRFAAIAPFCGWTVRAWLPNLANVPALIVHGDADSTVPISAAAMAAAWLKNAGYKVRFDVLQGGGHDAWSIWSRQNSAKDLLDWFRLYKRSAWPDRISVALSHVRYGKRYWVTLAETAQAQSPASLDVKVVDERHITVEAVNVASFELDSSNPKLARTGRLVLTVSGVPYTVDAGRGLVRMDLKPGAKNWEPIPVPASGTQVARHDGGGAADLFYRPLYIVYGTRKRNRSAYWKACAETLADWSPNPSMSAGSVSGNSRVIPDTAVTPEMLQSASLFLLGSAEENSVTQKIDSKIPVATGGKSFAAGGKTWTGAAVLQTCPNPLSPGNLVSVLSSPLDLSVTQDFCRLLNIALRAYGLSGDDTASFMTGDVYVFRDSMTPLWKGSFNRDWRNLRP